MSEPLPTLRPYQVDLVEAAREAYAQGLTRVLLQSPTGSGKTLMFLMILLSALERGWYPIAIVFHTRHLIDAAVEILTRHGIEHGVIAAGYEPNPGARVQVCSIQTLRRRLPQVRRAFRLLIVDECFVAGTLIDGRPIERLRQGDLVRSFNPQTGVISVQKVTRIFRRYASRVVRVVFSSGRTVVATPNHPFWTTDGWQIAATLTKGCSVYVDPLHREGLSNELQNRSRASRVEVGDRDRWPQSFGVSATSAGPKENRLSRIDRVDRIEIFEQGRDPEFDRMCPGGVVYNFAVEGTETYFAEGLAVHNCHHTPAKSYREIIAAFPGAKVLGVSATPVRLDGRGLKDLFEVLIPGPQIKDLERLEFLAPMVVFAPPLTADLSQIRRLRGDYDPTQLAEVMSAENLLGEPVSHWRRHVEERFGGSRPTILFAVNVRHSQLLAARFRDAGVVAVHIDAKTSDVDRRAALAGLAAGQIEVLSNCGLISEGLDVPDVWVLSVNRPTRSLTLHSQMLGRLSRPAPGKSCGLVLDHAGNCLVHGRPNQDRTWHLEGRAKTNLPPLRACPACHALVLIALRECPQCHCVLRVPDSGNGAGGAQPRLLQGDLARLDDDPDERPPYLAFPRAWKKSLDWAEAGDSDIQVALRLGHVRAALGYRWEWLFHRLRERGTPELFPDVKRYFETRPQGGEVRWTMSAPSGP